MKAASLLVFVLLVHGVGAQSIVIKGGVDLTSRLAHNRHTLELPVKPGWIVMENAAILYEQHFSNTFSVTGGLGLTGRGYSGHTTIHYVAPNKEKNIDLRLLHRFHYLDIPISAKIRRKIRQDRYLYGYAGLYTGIIGAVKRTVWSAKADTNDIYVQTSMTAIDPQKWKPRWDFGCSLGGGIELKGFLIEGTFSLGLINSGPISYVKRTNNLTFMLSAGYRFKLLRGYRGKGL